VICTQGRTHDFELFKQSQLKIPPEVQAVVDLGYQGIQKLLKDVQIPHKKPRGAELTAQQKQENRARAKQRIFVEHVNRRCKIFKIVKDPYRGKHRNLGKNWNLIAGIVNLRYRQ
jgi:hypothetical protein